jgi:hypothetical protein
MPTRRANYSDLRPAAEVAAAAFVEEELFGTLLHPHRREYWEDYVRFFEQDFRVKWLQRTYVILVAVDELGKVVGIAKWERQGDGGKARGLGLLDPSMCSIEECRVRSELIILCREFNPSSRFAVYQFREMDVAEPIS